MAVVRDMIDDPYILVIPGMSHDTHFVITNSLTLNMWVTKMVNEFGMDYLMIIDDPRHESIIP